MRRYAKRGTERSAGTEHLDPDELNAFAQAALPPAARSRYLSHLADCDDCRKLASQLTIAEGGRADSLAAAPEPISELSWWRKLKVAMAPASLRYAAFAMVVVAVAGISFLAWRQPPQQNAAVATRNQPAEAPAERLTQPSAADSTNKEIAKTFGDQKAVAQPTVQMNLDKKESDVTTVSPAPAAKGAGIVGQTETKSVLAENRAVETERAAVAPAYAPPPPIENTQNRAREQQSIAGAIPGGPRRNESYEKYKVDRSRASEAPKDSGEGGRAMTSQPTVGGVKQEEASPRARKDSRTPSVRTRDADEVAEDARKPATTSRAGADDDPPTRSVGGRKFQRNGAVWTDTKFKSSMSVRNVARGSDDFDALDSGLRSIAQQLGGDIVVVWKGKAYRIR